MYFLIIWFLQRQWQTFIQNFNMKKFIYIIIFDINILKIECLSLSWFENKWNIIILQLLIIRNNFAYSLLLDDNRMIWLVHNNMIWTNICYFCVYVFMLCSQIYFGIITILMTYISFTINWKLKLWRYCFDINLYAIISCISTL